MKKPAIIHIIDSLTIGGAEILLRNTIATLEEFSHVIVFLYPEQELIASFAGETQFICLYHKGWGNLLGTVRKLKKIIKNHNPCLVHSHLFHSTICARLATPASVPLITTLHSTYSIDAFKKNRNSIWAERMTLKNRHTLIGVSDYVLKDYLNYVPFNGKKFVLYNFLPDQSFAPVVPTPSSSKLRCLALGNLKEAKNYPFLLQMLSAVKDLDISLDIYGEGPLHKELQETIAREKLNVRLCGKADDVQAIFKNYDLFLQASSHEGFGLSVIEAMAAGLPVFISDIRVFREITGGNAHFFSLQNLQAAINDLKRLHGDSALRQEHVTEGFGYCQQHYSSASYKTNLLSIYGTIANVQVAQAGKV